LESGAGEASPKTRGPVLGARRIDEITRGDVISVLEGIIKDEKPTLANRTKAVVSKLFSWALDREMIDAHPCARLGSMMPKEQKRERVLTDPELKKLWESWFTMGFPFGLFGQLLLVTAQRRGEVATMHWRDIDSNARLWTLPKTKAGHGHEVPLSPLALEILKRVPRVDGSSFVFPRRHGRHQKRSNGQDKPVAPKRDLPISGFSKAAKAMKDNSGVDGWCLHDLRRTAATNMARMSVPNTTISRVLNHAEGGVTSIYARHGYFEEKRDALERWALRLGEILKSKKGTTRRPVEPRKLVDFRRIANDRDALAD
jgi:integrase